MQQTIRPFDGTDPSNTTEVFLSAITAYMIMGGQPKKIESRYQEAWMFKLIAMIQTNLISHAQHWYSHLPVRIKKTGKLFANIFKRTLSINNCKHNRSYF